MPPKSLSKQHLEFEVTDCERLAAYKAKIQSKDAARALKKQEKLRQQDEKERKRQEELAKTWALVEEEKRRAKVEWARVNQLKKEEAERQEERKTASRATCRA